MVSNRHLGHRRRLLWSTALSGCLLRRLHDEVKYGECLQGIGKETEGCLQVSLVRRSFGRKTRARELFAVSVAQLLDHLGEVCCLRDGSRRVTELDLASFSPKPLDLPIV